MGHPCNNGMHDLNHSSIIFLPAMPRLFTLKASEFLIFCLFVFVCAGLPSSRSRIIIGSQLHLLHFPWEKISQAKARDKGDKAPFPKCFFFPINESINSGHAWQRELGWGSPFVSVSDIFCRGHVWKIASINNLRLVKVEIRRKSEYLWHVSIFKVN